MGGETDDGFRQALIERFPDSPTRPARATIQQTMFLANSEQMAALFSLLPQTTPPCALGRRPVFAAFRRALIRDPDAEELAHGVEFLNAHGDSRPRRPVS